MGPREASSESVGLVERAPAGLVDSPRTRHARGAFFTPQALASYVVDWAIRSRHDQVLEPSCGEAAFLLAAGHRLQRLGGHPAPAPAASVAVAGTGSIGLTAAAEPALTGVELHEASAAAARRALQAAGLAARIHTGDFFLHQPLPSYDVVVGNPPYVRYQEFAGESRARSREAALRAGVSLTALASSWAAFTVHAALFLRDGGRLGLVLPAELLTVNYAAQVRRFLMDRFASVRLVMFTERVFPGVLEEVVLLLGDGFNEGPTDHCELYQVQNAEALSHDAPDAGPHRPGRGGLSGTTRRGWRTWRPIPPEGKWTASLMPDAAHEAMTRVTAAGGYATLHAWGETTLGMVTGNNAFFARSPAEVRERGLTRRDVLSVSPPGSRHLRAVELTRAQWRTLGASGRATYLFRPPGEPSPAGWALIAEGEARGVDAAYKCRIRSPWWRVPLVPPADLLLTYMNADTPRLCLNAAKVHHLNSVHGLYLHDEIRDDPRDPRSVAGLLPVASLSTVTLLGAETVGRAYGGGMLKLEPREADRLPVPSPALVAAHADALALLRPAVLSALRMGSVTDAAALVDEVLLVQGLGLSCADVAALREAHAALAARRVARGSTPVPGPGG